MEKKCKPKLGPLPNEIHGNQIASDVKRLWKNYYNKDAKPSLENEMCKPILG
ncbi:MAG: hypothetical protein RLZZ205_834 [Bacteroidota bacterium]|jgi:hypothetical protein